MVGGVISVFLGRCSSHSRMDMDMGTKGIMICSWMRLVSYSILFVLCYLAYADGGVLLLKIWSYWPKRITRLMQERDRDEGFYVRQGLQSRFRSFYKVCTHGIMFYHALLLMYGALRAEFSYYRPSRLGL